ncbi:exonuclease [Microbacterium phage Hortus1]|nr:exonuclease [Microbacterium phage Hortus1]AWY05640.1 exonuclease [Microbacterium phage OlinDD]
MRREDAPEVVCVWDTETGGVKIEQDRIYTAYAMLRHISGQTIAEKSWIINPGEPINPAAAEVNGLTDEFIQENGMPSRHAINEIYMFLSDARRAGYPLVGYNQAFDLGILSHEVRRHFGFDMWDSLGDPSLMSPAQFFDPFVYDVGTVEKRRGNRKLMTVAGQHYGIPIDESRLHEAKYDVEVTNHLAWKMLKRSPWTLAEMQPLQVQWRKRYADGLTDYFARIGKTEEDGSPIVVDDSFPWNRTKETV